MNRRLHQQAGLPQRRRGFTLVEMAVALVVVGLVVGIASAALTEYTKRSDVQRADNIDQARDIELAIYGFVQANSRLPCPDQVVAGVRDGIEDCTAAGGGKLAVGFLPHKTLQLYQDLGRDWAGEIAYAAYRATDADTAELVQKYNTVSSNHTPSCSGDAASATVVSGCEVSDKADIDTTSDLTFQTTSTALNMLDFCGSLQIAAAASADASLLHVNNPAQLNVAYAFALPSSPRVLVDGAGYLESRHGLTTLTEFQTSLSNSATNDDLTRIVSFNRLYQAYNCPDRVSGILASYHRDLSQISNEFAHRIHLANAKIMMDIAEGGIGSAERDVTFGAIGIALSTADLAIAVAEIATLNFAAVANVAVATLELGLAIANEVLAVQALEDANDWYSQTQTHYGDFQQRLVVSGNELNAARSIGHAAEQRGGL